MSEKFEKINVYTQPTPLPPEITATKFIVCVGGSDIEIKNNIHKQFSSPPKQVYTTNLICVCGRSKDAATRFCVQCTELVSFEVDTYSALVVAACAAGVVVLLFAAFILTTYWF